MVFVLPILYKSIVNNHKYGRHYGRSRGGWAKHHSSPLPSWTVNLHWTKWALAFVCFSFFFYISSGYACARLSITFSFWVHVNSSIVSYLPLQKKDWIAGAVFCNTMGATCWQQSLITTVCCEAVRSAILVTVTTWLLVSMLQQFWLWCPHFHRGHGLLSPGIWNSPLVSEPSSFLPRDAL